MVVTSYGNYLYAASVFSVKSEAMLSPEREQKEEKLECRHFKKLIIKINCLFEESNFQFLLCSFSMILDCRCFLLVWNDSLA